MCDYWLLLFVIEAEVKHIASDCSKDVYCANAFGICMAASSQLWLAVP